MSVHCMGVFSLQPGHLGAYLLATRSVLLLGASEFSAIRKSTSRQKKTANQRIEDVLHAS